MAIKLLNCFYKNRNINNYHTAKSDINILFFYFIPHADQHNYIGHLSSYPAHTYAKVL